MLYKVAVYVSTDFVKKYANKLLLSQQVDSREFIIVTVVTSIRHILSDTGWLH